MNRILLVDDNESSNFLSKTILEDAGINDIKEVFNGMEACQYLERNCPDVIFLDINMPIMDGWEFLEEKQAKELCKDVKIAMLTSSVRPIDKKKAESYPSVIAYLEKPLTEEKIASVRRMMGA